MTPWVSEQAKIGMAYLEEQGLSKEQAAAVLGNFIAESNLHPKAIGDVNLPQHAHGIGQWRGDRWSNLLALAKTRGKDPYDYLLQLEFALSELGSHEKYAGDRLFAAKTVEDAVEAMVDYERPAGWTKKFPRHAYSFRARLNAARSLL